MANTSVFTLGVTAPQPLGSAIDALRQSLERLRRQADDTRLGRLIGEVIRLGLELDKVRQMEGVLALNQAEQHEAQILRLGREIDQVERLRLGYLRLMPVGGYLPWAGAASAPPGRAVPAAADPAKDVSTSAQRTPRSIRDRMQIAGAIGAATIVGGRLAYEMGRGRTPNSSRRVTRAVRKTWKAGAGEARDKAVKAMLTGETGEERAEGVGAAVGELGGALLGATLASRLKNRRLKRYLPKLGGMLGETFGQKAGGGLFDLVMYEDKVQTSASTVDAAQASEQQAAVEHEGELMAPVGEQRAAAPELESTSARAPEAATSAPTAVTSASPRASPATSRVLNISRKLMRRVPGIALLDAGLQLAETYGSNVSPDKKLESYGTAVGGLSGGLAGAAAGAAFGSVVPGIGTVIGGLIGGVLGSAGGEIIGGLSGKALGSTEHLPDKPGLGEVARALPVTPVQPISSAPAVQSAATPAPLNQQFTFTANMPVTFNNSLNDPSVIQQLEQIARRTLTDLMARAQPAQMVDSAHV
ncbi:hypothetical protein ACIPM0_05780 [Pseudomonas sichuanensis]|uniref:hypothetical protein n=1 Tax=Pseudomonas TaxID=286 RepID=UPI00380D61BD